MKTIELTEYQTRSFPRDDIPKNIINELRQKYQNKVKVKLQDTSRGDEWQLTSRGWVGYIPLTPEFTLKLQPKVPIQNLFGMLDYAYHLKSFRFLDGLIDCHSLEEWCDRLAALLANRILDRCRKGLYRAYLPKTDRLAYIRGRLDVRQAIQKPWNVKLNCQYEEYTGDIEDNQILAWTLRCITRAGWCGDRTRSLTRQAYRVLQGFVTLKSFKLQECIGRKYNRLNQDYQTLHALCRFFLENSGPNIENGNNTMLPFLVDMARLYELFVAEWLKEHLPDGFALKAQERVDIDRDKTLHFNIDLVLYEISAGAALYVLDTKYKTTVVNDDVKQAVAYAVSKNCGDAILVYPFLLTAPLDKRVGHVRVRSLCFSLDGNLEEAGKAFLNELLNLS